MHRLLLFLAMTMFLNGSVYAETEQDATIPVVDMRDCVNPETRGAFVSGIRDALRNVGFFAITHTGVPLETVDEAYATMEAFFALDHDVKQECDGKDRNYQRGYASFGHETAKGFDEPDFKEFWSTGRELTEEQQQRLGFYHNLWPNHMDIKSSLLRLFKALEQYAAPLESAICEALELEPDFITQMTREGDCMLRSIHYPAPGEDHKGKIWAAEHTDINFYTLLPKATGEGLEVMMPDGTWTRVKVPEDAFIFNAGDMLENLTNGYFRSARHRVRAPTQDLDRDRFSMVFFVHPRNEDRLDPLPQCVRWTGGKRLFANATRWELLMERLADLDSANDEMLRDLAESEVMERLLEVNRASPDAMRRLRDAGLASEAVLEKLHELEN